MPSGVQGLIAARLDTLSPDRKHLLQDAAVIGKVFWSGAVAKMGQGDREGFNFPDSVSAGAGRVLSRPWEGDPGSAPAQGGGAAAASQTASAPNRLPLRQALQRAC
jgi:hypothetical protein